MPWKSSSYPCYYTWGKFEANAAFTTFASNAKLWQIWSYVIWQNWANVAFANGLLQIFYTGKSIFLSSASQEDVVAWKSILGFAYIRRAMGGYRIDN